MVFHHSIVKSHDLTLGIEICSLEEVQDGGGHIVQFPPEETNLGLLVLRSGDY
jgi:hypothetical protein